MKIERVGLRGPDIRQFWLLLTGDIFVLNNDKGEKGLWMKVEGNRALLVQTGKFADIDSDRLVRVVRGKFTYEDHDEWDPRALSALLKEEGNG